MILASQDRRCRGGRFPACRTRRHRAGGAGVGDQCVVIDLTVQVTGYQRSGQLLREEASVDTWCCHNTGRRWCRWIITTRARRSIRMPPHQGQRSSCHGLYDNEWGLNRDSASESMFANRRASADRCSRPAGYRNASRRCRPRREDRCRFFVRALPGDGSAPGQPAGTSSDVNLAILMRKDLSAVPLFGATGCPSLCHHG